MPPLPPSPQQNDQAPEPQMPMGNSIGATPSVPGVSAPMTPEHKAQLQELLSKVKQEYSKWRSMRFGTQNQANEMRKDQLKNVFQMLQAKGVNLNDPKSVSAFLTQLKQTAPQHFEAITKALDYLLGANYENQQNDQEPMPESEPEEPESSLPGVPGLPALP